MKQLLGIFAHPDDETIDAGGTIAKYVSAGWTADLVCATRGGSGPWGNVARPTPETTLETVRSEELARAAEILGVRSITFLDYKDGTLGNKEPGDIEDALIQSMEDIRPDVVITAEPGGMTNHPDHSKLSYAVTYAFQEYVKLHEDKYNDTHPAPKLYYACFPESIISYLIKNKYFPAEAHGKPITGVEDKKITTVIDIMRYASKKVQAMDAHETQRELLTKYVSMPHSPFFSKEYFMLRLSGSREVFMGKTDRVSDRL